MFLVALRHIFLQLCTGGDLFTYIVDHTRLCEGEAKYIMYQLLKALMYLHDKMISHRGICTGLPSVFYTMSLGASLQTSR